MKNMTLSIILILFFPLIQSGDRYKNPVIELKEELSIGVLDGEEEYIFNHAHDIEVDSKGNIYVADAGDKTIKVYSSKGIFLKTIGRQGQGPGEFTGLSAIEIDKNDVLYTFDLQLLRITIFDPEGKFIKSYPRNESFMRDFFVDDEGNFVIKEQKHSFNGNKIQQIGEINIYSKDMELIRNIFSHEEKEIVPLRVVTKENTRSVFLSDFPYPEVISFEFISPDKIIYGATTTYDFDIHKIGENTTNRIIGKYKPLKVTKKDKDIYFNNLFSEGQEFSRTEKNRLKDEIYFPDSKPPFKKILIDDTGFILFVTYLEDEEKGTCCDLYDFDGNFLKKVYFKNLPEKILFKNGKIYGIVKTEDEWYKVVRFNLN